MEGFFVIAKMYGSVTKCRKNLEHAYIGIFGYITWMIILFVLMFYVRVKAINEGLSFRKITHTNEHISDFAYRVSRAHANCCENFPIFVAVVFIAAMTNTLFVINQLVYLFLAARIAQSCAHLSSGRKRVTLIRGIFFLVQICLIIYWMASIWVNAS